MPSAMTSHSSLIILAKQGMILMTFDLKPDFPDTPMDWQMQLELAFTSKKSPFAKRREETAARDRAKDPED